MTLYEVKTLFNNIATAHKSINDFEFGEIWEIEEKMNKNPKYPMLFVSPVQSVTTEQTKERTFQVLIFDMVNKDKSNQVNTWSDTEEILDDVIEILKKESYDYELVGEPVLLPFKEDNTDWATGHRAEIVLRTDKTVTHCNIPANAFVSPSAPSYKAIIKDQDGNIVKELKPGETYTVFIATGIDDEGGVQTVIVIDESI